MHQIRNGLITLRSARLHYDFVTSANAEPLWHLMRAPHLREYQDIPRLSYERFCERVRARPPQFVRGAVGRFEWLLRLEPDGAPIGWVSLRTSTNNPFCGELGYSILRGYRRQGYATEAVEAAVEAAFGAEVVDKISAYCLPENLGSRAVLERVGLVELRRVRRGAVVRGRSVDILLYEVDRTSLRRATRG